MESVKIETIFHQDARLGALDEGPWVEAVGVTFLEL
jgi:hypothetical protein